MNTKLIHRKSLFFQFHYSIQFTFPNFTAYDIENNSIDEKAVLLNDNYLQNILSNSYFQPIIKSAELRVRSANVGIRLAEAGKYPSVSLGAG